VLAGLDVTIMSVHLRTLLQKRGFSLAEAAALGALIGPAQVTGRIGEMMSGGRYHPFWPLAIATALGAIGMKGNRPDIGSSVFRAPASPGCFPVHVVAAANIILPGWRCETAESTHLPQLPECTAG
jgi:hypothetical protein